MRKRICAGNWKMYKTAAQAVAYIERFSRLVKTVPKDVEVVVCPPFTALRAVREALDTYDDGRVELGAQNMGWEDAGAFTGEISPPMLLDCGVHYVIIGHSERRLYFGETDQYVRLKTAAAFRYGFVPIVAVGESLDVREAGEARNFVVAQVQAGLDKFTDAELAKIVIAYEPIWAIGTGKNCDPSDADEMMGAIRACVRGLANVPILYGGSVKPENVAAYCGEENIDGFLVGGASLDPDAFARIAVETA